jgi:hypothetical protein
MNSAGEVRDFQTFFDMQVHPLMLRWKEDGMPAGKADGERKGPGAEAFGDAASEPEAKRLVAL